MDTTNPTLDPTKLSKTIVQETIRPALSEFAADHDLDADSIAPQRGDPWPRDPGSKPPLVVTAYPDKTLYPHIVIDEETATGSRIDQRHGFLQWDFAVAAECIGRTSTEMFRLKDGVRGFFSTEQPALRNAGFAELEISGSPSSWDSAAEVSTWEVTVSGIVHTHINGT